MNDPFEVVQVSVATVSGSLPSPIVFGDWIMRSREFAVVRLRLASGCDGWAYTLTRDGTVAEQIRKTVAPVYVGTSVRDRERTFERAWRSSLASHASGVGLRALSLADLAAWDAAARAADQSIAGLLGGENTSMPATAIVGYPPDSVGPAEIFTQVSDLSQVGWRRFKMAVSGTSDLTRERLRAARRAAPGAWIGLDGAWTFHDVDTACDFLNSITDVELGWFEDAFPPGDAKILRQLRERTSTPIAMGDEQGGSYYPQALLSEGSVDVIRIDLTCMGGVTRGKAIIRESQAAHVQFAPHMFGHVHSQVFGALGLSDVPIEWGIPWSGVDPYADSLAQPAIRSDGLMEPLKEELGFGPQLNLDWILSQPHSDPEGILRPS